MKLHLNRESQLDVLVERLEQENAALLADRDRLDWLEGEDGQSWTAKWYYWGEEWINRAAIDAARKEQP
jgi:hypothetical protein